MASKSEHRFVLRGDDKTKQAIDSARSNLVRLNSSFNKMNFTVAGLAGSLGLGLLGRSMMERINEMDLLAKNADKIGVTTQAYTELNYAVSQTSALTDQAFNMAMQRMTRKLGEAELGIGEGAKAFEALGLSIEDLAKLRPDEQFLKVADAVKALDDDQKQLAATAKIFDAEAAAIVTTLQRGSEEIEKYREEARLMGQTLTREQTAKAEAAKDAMDKLSRAWGGVSNNMTAALAGPFTNFIVWLTDAIPKVDTLVRKVFDLGVNLNRISLADLRLEMKSTQDRIEVLKDQLNTIAPRMQDGIQNKIDLLDSRVIRYKQRIEELTGATEKYTETTGKAFNFGTLGVNTPVISPDKKEPIEKALKPDEEKRKTAMQRFEEDARNTAQQFDQMWANSLHRFSSGVGNAFSTAILYGDNLSTGLRGALRGMTQQVLATLGTIAAKKLAVMAMEKAGIASTAAASSTAAGTTAAAWTPAAAAVSLGTGGANAVSAGSTIPMFFATLLGSFAALKGQMHAGGVVPSTGTYFLEGGESVTSKRHTKKLAQALDSGKMGGDVYNINLSLNAIDAKSGTEFIIQNEPAVTALIQRAFNSRGKPGPMG